MLKIHSVTHIQNCPSRVCLRISKLKFRVSFFLNFRKTTTKNSLYLGKLKILPFQKFIVSKKIKLAFTLTPENPGLIQEYHLEIIP